MYILISYVYEICRYRHIHSIMLESKADAHLANEFRWGLASSVYSMMFHRERPRHRNLLARRRLGVSDSRRPTPLQRAVAPVCAWHSLRPARKAPKLRSHGLQVPKVERYSCTTGSSRPSFHLEPSYQAADKCSDDVCTHQGPASTEQLSEKERYKMKGTAKNRGTT